MKTMNAADAKNRFGEVLDTARTEPVVIQKNGRDVAVMISKEEFDRTTKPNRINPLVTHLHEEIMDEFEDDFRRMAE